jgi:hypothetical protein
MGKVGDDKGNSDDGPYLNPGPFSNALVDEVDGITGGGTECGRGKDEMRGT